MSLVRVIRIAGMSLCVAFLAANSACASSESSSVDGDPGTSEGAATADTKDLAEAKRRIEALVTATSNSSKPTQEFLKELWAMDAANVESELINDKLVWWAPPVDTGFFADRSKRASTYVAGTLWMSGAVFSGLVSGALAGAVLEGFLAGCVLGAAPIAGVTVVAYSLSYVVRVNGLTRKYDVVVNELQSKRDAMFKRLASMSDADKAKIRDEVKTVMRSASLTEADIYKSSPSYGFLKRIDAI